MNFNQSNGPKLPKRTKRALYATTTDNSIHRIHRAKHKMLLPSSLGITVKACLYCYSTPFLKDVVVTLCLLEMENNA